MLGHGPGETGLAAVVVMAGVLYIVWTGVEVYAQHLCKWPATISCEDGPDIWWLGPSGLGVIAAAATWGLVNWARAGLIASPGCSLRGWWDSHRWLSRWDHASSDRPT